MAGPYSKVAMILNGLVQNVDLAAEQLIVNELKIGGNAGTVITKTAYDSLVSNSHASGSDNQNVVAGIGLSGGGSAATTTIDLDITELTAETAVADGDLIAVYDVSASAHRKMTKANFVSGLSTDTKEIKVSSNDSTPGFLFDKLSVADVSTNSTTVLEVSVNNEGANEALVINFDQTLISHSSIADLNGDDHTQYHNDSRGDARYFQKSEHLNTSAGAGDAGKPIKLDGAGKIANSMLPAIAITDTFVVASQVAMLALTAQTGDVAVRSDLNKSFILAGSDPTVLGDWQELLTPTDLVLSVNGNVGAVTVNAINQLTGDITAGPASGSASAAATIANSAVTTAKIANDAVDKDKIAADVAGNGLGQNVDGSLEVKVDDTTVELNADALRIKDLGVSTAKLAATSVTAAKLGSDVAGAGLSGGNGSALAVSYSPAYKQSMLAGESLAANTSFLIRCALSAETAGRMYKATNVAAAADGKFYAMGVVMETSAKSAGDAIIVTLGGVHTLGSSDTNFNAGDVGKPVYLTTAGGFSITAPSGSGEAVWRIGMVQAVDKILVGGMQLNGIA